MDCQVVLCQTNPALGDLHANLDDHVARAEQAAEQGADLVVFPELSLTGYFLKDQTFEVGISLDAPELARLAELSERVSILAGCVERTDDGRLYNASLFFERGELIGGHRKVHLVAYGMFDEVRDLAPGEDFEPIESRLGRFGVMTCEDAWHLGGTYLHFLNEVDALLIVSAGPARGVQAPGPGFASERVWGTLLTSAALHTQTWVAFCNRVGFEDGVAFGGGSRVVDPFGETVAMLEGLDAGTLAARLDSDTLHRARVLTPLRRDERPDLLLGALSRRLLGRDLAGDGDEGT